MPGLIANMSMGNVEAKKTLNFYICIVKDTLIAEIFFVCKNKPWVRGGREGREGLHPYIALTGMCDLTGYGFHDFLSKSAKKETGNTWAVTSIQNRQFCGFLVPEFALVYIRKNHV